MSVDSHQSDAPSTSDASYVPPLVDESKGVDLGPLDIVLGVLTLPLLLFAIQYAVSGSEALLATRAARLKVYGVLLTVELIVAAAILTLVFR
ncbi:MAG: hypothetical protein JWN41_170 [Thermoleophilia bacterium]|nr:hypothetical protein [Thermoleophilia bacterium]